MNRPLSVFTLQSIKSRIETADEGKLWKRISRFLLYSPLNQGLKPTDLTPEQQKEFVFLLYSPLNQGLKHIFFILSGISEYVFTLQSIKSRIETDLMALAKRFSRGFYSTVH
mgnify:CR=1 FL=1